MQRYYQSLSEKGRRRYAGIEAIKLGHGGISYISRVLGCDYRTIKSGMAELQDDGERLDEPGIRRRRGGRKSAFEVIAGLDAVFLKVMEHHTAGSPVDETVRWTNLSRPKIAELLKAEKVDVSVTVVDQLLKKHEHRHILIAFLISSDKISIIIEKLIGKFFEFSSLRTEFVSNNIKIAQPALRQLSKNH